MLSWLWLSFAYIDFFPRIDATDDQIKRAHRQKVLKHHPDKRKHAGEEVIFSSIITFISIFNKLKGYNNLYIAPILSFMLLLNYVF